MLLKHDSKSFPECNVVIRKNTTQSFPETNMTFRESRKHDSKFPGKSKTRLKRLSGKVENTTQSFPETNMTFPESKPESKHDPKFPGNQYEFPGK